jgi:Glycosyltransferase family 9 (heptosyltransferase)
MSDRLTLLKSLLAQPERKILVTAYAGIGDAILAGPILRTLNRLYPGRIVYPENPALSLYQSLRVADLDNIATVGRELRRIVDFTPEELLELMKRYRIGVIFNLRRDRVKFQQKYTALAESINGAGLALTDICEFASVEQQSRIHTFDLWLDYFARLGLELDQHRFGWLGESVMPEQLPLAQPGKIAFYLGAGQPIKRMTVAFWRQLINRIHQHTKITANLICGVTEEEHAQGRELAALLSADGICHQLISQLSLPELARVVMDFRLVVSGDTFMVHLAEALGVRVVGIYCATNPQVYGPYHKQNLYAKSSFYSVCEFRNQIGNCDGWDIGCAGTPCKCYVNPEEVTRHVLHSMVS